MSPLIRSQRATRGRARDVEPEGPAKGSPAKVGALANWLDERTGMAKAAPLLKKVFPDHWSFMLGEIAMFSLVILLLTGRI